MSKTTEQQGKPVRDSAARIKATLALPLLGTATAGFLIALVIATLWYDRNQELAEAETTTRNLSEVIEEQTARTLQTVDTALLVVSGSLRSDRPGTLRMNNALRNALLHLPYVRAMWVLDAGGRLIYDSDSPKPPFIDFSDREYFRWHLRGASGLFVSKPLQSRTTGEWFIALSRPIQSADGHFGGVVVAALEPRYFERFYHQISVGRQGAISIRHVDGEMIARTPAREDMIGKPLPFKAPKFIGPRTIRVVSAVDGVERIYTARPVEAAPLIVSVGLGVNEVLSVWRREVVIYSAATLVFSLLIAALTWWLTRELQRREALGESLRKEEVLLHQVVENLPVAVYVADPDGRIFLTNSAGRRIWGAAEKLKTSDYARFKGRWSRTGLPLEPADWAMTRALRNGEISNSEMIDIECFDGSHKTILNWAAPIRDETGRLVGGVAVNEDITDQRKLAEELGESEARFEAMFEYSSDATLIMTPDGRVLAANREACRLLGYSHEELLSADPPPEIMARDDARTVALLDQRERLGHARGETAVIRRDGHRFPGEISSALYRDARGEIKASLTVRDITDRKQAEERIAYLAYHDELTGLPNRAALTRTLEQALVQGERHRREFALMMLDLDGFKEINDQFGHDIGDRLLVQVGRRLRACVREGDAVARFGGDEFVLMLEQPGGEDEVRTVARKILGATSAKFEISGRWLSVTASIGVAIYPRDGDGLDTLLRAADTAMYRAKDLGSNRVEVHQPG